MASSSPSRSGRQGRSMRVNIAGRAVPIPVLVVVALVVLYCLVFPSSLPFHTAAPAPPAPPASTDTLYGLTRTSSSFLVRPDEFVAAPPRHLRLPQMGELPAPLAPRQKDMRVPDAVHYVYGLKAPADGESGPELPYYAYLAMRSALINLKPKKMYFHYEHLPRGPWWDLLEPHLTLIKTKAPEEIFGRQLHHFAHKADVLRLFAIKGMGGIYLDIDVFVIRPFDDLLYYPTTLGMEAHPSSGRRWTLDVEGLCNGVIISEPNAPFIDRWIQSYVNFESDDWAAHSVRKPWELARQHPEELQVLNPTAFFSPLWTQEEVQPVHTNNEYDFAESGQYAYHAWESMAMDYLRELTPWAIRDTDTSFHRLVRPFLGPDDDAVYRRWKAE